MNKYSVNLDDSAKELFKRIFCLGFALPIADINNKDQKLVVTLNSCHEKIELYIKSYYTNKLKWQENRISASTYDMKRKNILDALEKLVIKIENILRNHREFILSKH